MLYRAGRVPLVAVASLAADDGPVGPRTGFLAGRGGYRLSLRLHKGRRYEISLLPPNDNDVNQSRVSSAPKVGPFKININGSLSGWPDACKLTSLAQLKTLEPAITGLRGAPVGAKAKDLSTGGSTPHNAAMPVQLEDNVPTFGLRQHWLLGLGPVRRDRLRRTHHLPPSSGIAKV